MASDPDDIEVLHKARPILRSAIALALYLRFGKPETTGYDRDDAYLSANAFLDQLEEDMGK